MSSAAMSLGQISHKPNEMDGVFTARQKFGSYKVKTPEQKKFLKAEFMKNPFPNHNELLHFSQKTGVNAKKIHNWFVYMRRVDFSKEQKFVKKMKKKFCFDKSASLLLEKYFREKSHLDKKALTKLQTEIGCDPIYIKRWFLYRNQKLKRMLKIKTHNLEKKKQLNDTNSINSVIIKEEKKEYEPQKQQTSIFSNNPMISNFFQPSNVGYFAGISQVIPQGYNIIPSYFTPNYNVKANQGFFKNLSLGNMGGNQFFNRNQYLIPRPIPSQNSWMTNFIF